jgi:ParB-like chromosome segregation protein Spo0J
VYPGTGAEAQSYLIVSGVTRYLAASRLDWKTLDARVDATLDPENTLALVKASRLHNDTHRETDLDHAILARELLAAGHTAAKIAEALGCSRRDVERMKAFFALPSSVLERGKTRPEKFSASFAELLKKAARTLGEDRTVDVLKQVFARNLSLNETARLIEEEENHRVRAPRARRSEKKMFNLAGKEIGEKIVLVAPDGKKKIRLLLTLDASLGEDLNAELDELLERFMAAEEGEGENG